MKTSSAMKKFSTTLILLFASVISLVAQDIPSIQKDLKSAQDRLTKQREAIAAEKPTIAKSFDETRASLLEKRRIVRIARMSKSDRETLLKELEKKHYTTGQDYNYVDGQLRDYGLKLETFLLPGEGSIYSDALEGIRKSDGLPAEKLKARLQSLEAGIDRLEKLIGGSTVTGEAVAPDGTVKSGTFALAGPAAWFAAEDGSLTGSVVMEKGSRSPKVLPGESGGIKTVLAGGEASLSIDVTGGKALALATLENDKLDIFRKGGFWIWPILAIALFSAISGVIKLAQIIRIRTPDADWVSRILASLREGDKASAEALASGVYHPVSDVVSQCLNYVKAGPNVVEEVLYEQLIGVQNKLQNWLPFIAITAATAPLLGLLGTVSGMIRTFNVITVSGTGDAKPLAGGISEALVTTLFGLVVAIPALIIHALLSRRCQGVIQNTEKLGLTLVNGLRGEKFQKPISKDPT
jgi:biopolymer transport protein ExbB